MFPRRLFCRFLGAFWNEATLRDVVPAQMNQEFPMKKIIIASAALALMSGSAFAQTGPAPQADNMQKPGMHNSEKGSMTKGSMNKGTTGMSSDGMSKDGMAKGGMMKPDASGQGGSGPGSDQGGTKAGNMK
jgi:pentapeptide MXKDX repeat protein